MNVEREKWSRRYRTALCKHLKQGAGARPRPLSDDLGREAVTLGLEPLDVARIHTQALAAALLPGGTSVTQQRMSTRAKHFFIETIVPIEKTHRAARQADVHAKQLTHALCRRTMESSAATRRLQRSVCLRQGEEQSIEKDGKRHAKLLAELHRLQNHLRDLAHTCLSAQEDERQRMSLHLQDEIAQALIAIDLRLLTLKKVAKASTASLKKEIASTQQFMQDSTKRIGHFAHELGIRHEK